MDFGPPKIMSLVILILMMKITMAMMQTMMIMIIMMMRMMMMMTSMPEIRADGWRDARLVAVISKWGEAAY